MRLFLKRGGPLRREGGKGEGERSWVPSNEGGGKEGVLLNVFGGGRGGGFLVKGGVSIQKKEGFFSKG